MLSSFKVTYRHYDMSPLITSEGIFKKINSIFYINQHAIPTPSKTISCYHLIQGSSSTPPDPTRSRLDALMCHLTAAEERMDSVWGRSLPASVSKFHRGDNSFLPPYPLGGKVARQESTRDPLWPMVKLWGRLRRSLCLLDWGPWSEVSGHSEGLSGAMSWV